MGTCPVSNRVHSSALPAFRDREPPAERTQAGACGLHGVTARVAPGVGTPRIRLAPMPRRLTCARRMALVGTCWTGTSVPACRPCGRLSRTHPGLAVSAPSRRLRCVRKERRAETSATDWGYQLQQPAWHAHVVRIRFSKDDGVSPGAEALPSRLESPRAEAAFLRHERTGRLVHASGHGESWRTYTEAHEEDARPGASQSPTSR